MTNKWDARLLNLARHKAEWSKDPSTKVGAVIADGNRDISHGYNGPPRNIPDEETDRATKLRRTIHAEVNAILFAQRDVSGMAMYVTHHPCGPCAALIAQAGIARVVIPEAGPKLSQAWSDDIKEAQWIFEQAGITLERIKIGGND